MFAVGDLIDCMDKANMWYESYITQVSDFDGSIKVHFMGWGQKWDDVVTKSQISTRISPLNSKSKNWRAELFNGGLIEIKCNEDVINQKWMWGRIVALDEVCECVDVSYSFENENPIIKRADLYGETICPIGMHTKDRSKAQAALIISPSIKIEENIRRTYEESFGDDIFFLDKGDQVDPKNINNLRSFSQSTSPLENIAFITLEMIMAQILDILENYSVKLNKAKHLDIDSSPRNISNVDKLSFTAAKLALLTISISAYKRILSPLLCRPLITRCCLRLKLYASLALAGCTDGNVTKLFQTFSDLAEISDDLSQSFGSSIEICLGKVLPQVIGQFIKSKLIESTKQCYRSIVEDALMRKDVYKINLRDFLSSCYLDNLKNKRMTSEVIRIRNIIGRVSECPDSAFITYFQNEWFVALENWVSTFLSESIQVHSSEFDHEMKLLKDLVFMLNSAQFISGSIFNSMNLTTSFADAVFSTVFSKLDIKLFDELSKQTSLMFSFILDKRYNNEENVGQSSCGIILDDLLNFLNVIKNEKLISSLKVYYIPMTARRLLRGYSLSLHQEKLILDNLCIGAPLEGMIQEISDDSSKSVMKSYKQFLMKSSQSASGNLKVLSKLDARYLSYHLWAKYKPFSTISEVILPEQLSIMKEKFCEFQNSFGAKRITSFYLGLGTITLSCAIKRKKFDILLPEAHGILLLAFHHLKCLRTTYKAIGDMTGFSISQIRTIVNELYNCIDGGILNSNHF